MPSLKLACWNIYFSWELVEKHRGRLRITPAQRDRAENVASIIRRMDTDLLGIIEGGPRRELSYFLREKCPEYDGLVLNEDATKYTLAVAYKRSAVSVEKLRVNVNPWKAKIGDDRSEKNYRFARPPLVLQATCQATGRELVVGVLHAKSKRPKGGLSRVEKDKEAVRNRKRIVGEALRLRELLYGLADRRGDSPPRFLIMGDINDGPDFDRYEKQIWTSGIESLLGSVLDPGRLLYSFVDLSNGRGEPTSSFANGSIQLDHIVHTPSMRFGRRLPKIRGGSGRVRSDLVDITEDGKRRDSDHAPVEVRVRF